MVSGRPLLADLLAELVPAQEGDERRAGDDPEKRRHHRRAEHQLHGSSASTSASRPDRAAALDEHHVARAGHARRGRGQRRLAVGIPGTPVRARERPDGDHPIDAELADERADLVVVGGVRPRPARPCRPARRRSGALRRPRPGGAARPPSRSGWRCSSRRSAGRRRQLHLLAAPAGDLDLDAAGRQLRQGRGRRPGRRRGPRTGSGRCDAGRQFTDTVSVRPPSVEVRPPRRRSSVQHDVRARLPRRR